MSTPTARPRQTTMAGVMVMLGATFMVLAVWDTVTRLRSVESREWIESLLATGPGGYLADSVESMIQTLHVVSLVTAVCAVAAIALGWQVLQRSTGARVALSAVAVPLFLSGVFAIGSVAGAFASALVAGATAILWRSPSRQWFAGLPIPEQSRPRPPSRMQVWEQTSNRGASGTTGPKSDPAHQGAELGPGSAPAAGATGWSVSAAAHDRRPDPVTVALVLTVVVASVMVLMTMSALALLLSQPEVFLEDMRQQNPPLADDPWTDAYLTRASFLIGAVIVIWSAVAIGLAFLMANRRAWAARGLTICAAVCAVLCVISALASPIALIPGIAAAATVSCLRRPDVRAWFDGG